MILKKVLSVFLAIVMVVVIVPVTTVIAEKEYSSGIYTFTVTDGKATITAVPSYIIGKVVIPDMLLGYPVVAIGNAAFYSCTDIIDVTIPNSVTSIGDQAFSYCSNLTSITIPDNAMNIGEEAFLYSGYYKDSSNWDNSVLYIGNHIIRAKTDVTGDFVIKDGTISIADYAFNGCVNLTGITIPDSVKTVGLYSFSSCSNLKNVYITDIEAWCNISFSSNSSNPLSNQAENFYVNGELATDIIIPDGITEIKPFAFFGSSTIVNITIPDSVTSIGQQAFAKCDNLISITIPDSVTSIGSSILSGCSGLRSITIPFTGDKKEGPTKTHFGYLFGSFDYVTQGQAAYIPESLKEVSITGEDYISNYAFANCVYIEDIILSNSITSIGKGAFRGCQSLDSINIPDRVTTIDTDAFLNCGNLKDVYITDIAAWYNITFNNSSSNPLCNGTNLYLDGELVTDLVISEKITEIKDYVFYGCVSLVNVTISDSITSISNNAFYGCTSLENVTIPDSVRSIGDYAFTRCENLASVILPEAVTLIGNSAFSGCTNLTVYCYDNTHAYVYSLLNGIPFVIIEREFIIEGGILTKYNGNATNVVIPDDVTAIGASAFAFCSGIKSVTIPEGVTFIGTGAFSFCPGLVKVVLPSTLETIDTGAFAFCPALSDIEIPESVTLIGDGAFDCCYALGEVYIRDTVETIGEDAFNGCEALTLRCYSTAPAATYAEENDVNYRLIISGDADDDGAMNLNDLVHVSKLANGAALETGYGADANRDGVVNLDDVTLISKMANGAMVG